jgi:hypothetical protein
MPIWPPPAVDRLPAALPPCAAVDPVWAQLQDAPNRGVATVSSEAAFRAALEAPNVQLIGLASNITLTQQPPAAAGPVSIARNVLITGPYEGNAALAVHALDHTAMDSRHHPRLDLASLASQWVVAPGASLAFRHIQLLNSFTRDGRVFGSFANAGVIFLREWRASRAACHRSHVLCMHASPHQRLRAQTPPPHPPPPRVRASAGDAVIQPQLCNLGHLNTSWPPELAHMAGVADYAAVQAGGPSALAPAAPFVWSGQQPATGHYCRRCRALHPPRRPHPP